MNNGWLQFLIPKEYIKVETLSDLERLRANGLRIYSVNHEEEGYVVTVRKGATQEMDVISNRSIYTGIRTFMLPVTLVWLALLVAVNFLTIDYEIRGNLPPEETLQVEEQLTDHFFQLGPFSVPRGNPAELASYLQETFHDYIWIDIKSEGNLLVISIYDTQITESEEGPMAADTIYATSSGVITSVEVSECRPLVEIGQVVRQGDPLITCYTPTGFAEEMAPIEGMAHGSVYAHVWYEMEIEFPREYVTRLLTSNSQTQWFLNVGGSRLNLWGNTPEFEDFEDRHSFFHPFGLFGVSTLTVERVQSYEKRDIIVEHEVEVIQEASYGLAKRQLEEVMSGDFELVTLQFLTAEETENKVRLIYHVTVEEDITQ